MRAFSAIAVAAAAALCSAAPVTISNVVPRTDNTGAIMDAHDGKIIHLNGMYHWWAASYGGCKEPAGNSGCSGAAPGACGFQSNHSVGYWTSTDMVTWTSHGPVFEMQNAGISGAIMFCPKVLYNANTKLFVLWINWIAGADFSQSFYGVATSANPAGPFTLVVKAVQTLAYQDTGDFNLFQDDDGSAYIIYTSKISSPAPNHNMSVEKLTPDYLGTLGAAGNSGFFGQSFVEAPAMFKRNGIYYAVFGSCCCYCQSGSPVIAYTATSPLGPYTQRNTIDVPAKCSASVRTNFLSRVAALLDTDVELDTEQVASSAMCSSLRGSVASGDPIHAQQTDIAQYMSSTGPQYMWIGDHWQSAPDGIKGHDFTVWSPMVFTPDGNITTMSFLSNFTVDVVAPPAQL